MERMYKMPEVKFGKVRPSKTVPDQSLSIQEIVKRYVKGIPVDVVKRHPVYSDQQDDDLEKLSRMDFGEKAAYAAQLAEQAKQLQKEWAELERDRREARDRQATNAAAEAANAQQTQTGPTK